ncbi:uncharacterized protein tedc2 [Pholidichthys leucotaenia]
MKAFFHRASQPKATSEMNEWTEDAATDGKWLHKSSDYSCLFTPLSPGAAASPGENEDMELLERALEKALRVRTGSENSKNDSSGNKLCGTRKEPGTSPVTSSDVTHSSTEFKGNQPTLKSTAKSVSIDRNGSKKPALSVSARLGSRPSAKCNPELCKTRHNRNLIQKHPTSSADVVHHRASRKSQQPGLATGSGDHISTLLSKNKTVRSKVLSGDGPGEAASVASPSNSKPPHTDDSEAGSVHQMNGIPSDQMTKWKHLRRKQNRLWDKVIALQRKPVPGRSHFVERMRSTFPLDWPCGNPDQTGALVDKLTHQVHGIADFCQAKEASAKWSTESSRVLEGEESEFDSCQTPERLQQTAAELQNFANQVKQEWKAWNRWRPEGGCLCPTGANSVWGDGITSPLPLTITYTTEEELQKLENVRMRVALLQQEIYLEQALLDAVSPLLSSIVPGPGCPSPSVLRDLYSLLGEGGQRFPAIVVDSDPS